MSRDAQTVAAARGPGLVVAFVRRGDAAALRREAARTRAQALRALDKAATDPLTGTRSRGPGLADLDREIDRVRRCTGSLVLAFVDVDGLKAVNDSDGHLAGDRLLTEVASVLRDGLRSYDLITRFGGDEFLCALSGIDVEEVQRRFDGLARSLRPAATGTRSQPAWPNCKDGDDTEALIARADHALLHARQGN